MHSGLLTVLSRHVLRLEISEMNFVFMHHITFSDLNHFYNQ